MPAPHHLYEQNWSIQNVNEIMSRAPDNAPDYVYNFVLEGGNVAEWFGKLQKQDTFHDFCVCVLFIIILLFQPRTGGNRMNKTNQINKLRLCYMFLHP